LRRILTTLAVAAIALQLQGGAVAKSRKAEAKADRPITVRVAVLCFNPYCPGHGAKRVTDVFNWYKPHESIKTYCEDLTKASGGWAKYKVVSFYDLDYFPDFEDGFSYTGDEYVDAWKGRPKMAMHRGMTDYYKLVADKSYDYNNPRTILERINAGDIDEVLLFSAPASMDGGGEAAMAGPNPWFINGGVFKFPGAHRNFPMMGVNYEREVGCMLEDFFHLTEAPMSRVYKSKDDFYPTLPATDNWEKFRMIDKVDPGNAACGFCHYAANSTGDYDWGNTTKVYSTCDDWLYNWPNLKGAETKRLVDNSEWGGGDTRLRHIWWLTHIPKAPGVNADGKQNNWWKYMCNYSEYPESR
jgi:hypothetical protein